MRMGSNRVIRTSSCELTGHAQVNQKGVPRTVTWVPYELDQHVLPVTDDRLNPTPWQITPERRRIVHKISLPQPDAENGASDDGAAESTNHSFDFRQFRHASELSFRSYHIRCLPIPSDQPGARQEGVTGSSMSSKTRTMRYL